jgi:acyl phosphate:glycerol-3-phosphate acyltransferase
MAIFIFTLLLAYLLGSLPTAVLYAKYFHGIDIREHGSGNAGATNSLRVLGKKAGAVVLLIDVAKGFALVYGYYYFKANISEAFLLGIAAILGHIYSVFTGFKGGKGVATALGVILAIDPISAMISIVVFALTVYLTKYVSLSSLLAALCFVLLIMFYHYGDTLFIAIGWFLFLLLAYTHRENIKKLIKGVENKIGG